MRPRKRAKRFTAFAPCLPYYTNLWTPGLDELLRCTEVCFRDRVSCVVRQSSDGRCLWEAGVEFSSNVIHRAAKIEILPAPHRDDAIPQRAEAIGDALPVADPEPVEVALYNRTRIAHLLILSTIDTMTA